MFCNADRFGHLPLPAVVLTVLVWVWVLPLAAQVELGGGLALLRLYGSDDSGWRVGAAATAGLRLHELWWAEAALVRRPWQAFQTQESYRRTDPLRQPAEVFRRVDGKSDWLQLGLALRGIAVPVGGRRRHLQYYGRVEAGWLAYRYRLNRPEVPSGFVADLPVADRWASVYVQPGAGVEWLYGRLKPYLQVGACLPLLRPDVPPGTNLSLASSFSGVVGLRIEIGKRK